MVWPELFPPVALVASLIVLVPGLEFTLAIKEISTENLVAGSARLTSAIGDFLLLAFGVALGTQVAAAALGPALATAPVALPAWTTAAAVVVAALGFAMRFMILLVPGSFGLRATELMLQHDVVSALGTVFSMLLVATALSTGLLLANLLLPSERPVRVS